MYLTTKWTNPMWDPNALNGGNILAYFCNRSNPFYSCQSNNEKQMMNRGMAQIDITQLQGDEYSLVHSQEPVLFIIAKSRRSSPTKVVPLSYYYVIQGEVMQVPDMANVVCARLQTVLYHTNQTLSILSHQVKHNSTNGTYSWDSRDNTKLLNEDIKNNDIKEVEDENEGNEAANQFHALNMAEVMKDWMMKYPPLTYPHPHQPPPAPQHPQHHQHHSQSSSSTVTTSQQQNITMQPPSSSASTSTHKSNNATPNIHQQQQQQPPNKKMRT